MSPGSYLRWLLVALLATLAHRAAASLLRAAAWRAVSLERPDRAHALARLLRALTPWRADEDALLGLASRALSGAPMDVDREVAALAGPTPSERAVFAVCLDAWRGDHRAAAARLDARDTLDAALAQGEAALALAAVAEARGVEAMCALWAERVSAQASSARGEEGTATLLVLAAELGDVDGVEALLDELRGRLPPECRGYWRARALYRAGRVDEGREETRRRLASTRVGAALRRRLEAMLRDPPAAAGDLPHTREVLAALRDRVDARVALAELGWHRSRGAWPATGAAVALLVAAHGALCCLGAQRVEGWVRWGALTVPLRGAGDAWRLLSYALLHADLAHLGVNAATLWTFGRFVERRLGALALLLTLGVGALCGGVAALWSAAPGTVVLGASAAVFALVGASVAHIAREPSLRRAPEGRGELALLGALLAAQGLYDHLSPQVSGGAHLGGLLAGVAVGAVTARRGGGLRR